MAKNKKIIEESQDGTLGEDSVSDNVQLGPLEGKSKINAMSVLMKGMAAMDDQQWVKFFNQVQAQVGHEGDGVPNGAGAKNAASVAAKGAMKEEIDAIFGGETLAEEAKEKMYTLFESAVNVQVALKEAELQENYQAKLAEDVASVTEGLIAKLDEYVSFIADEIVSENKVAITKNLRADLMEDFFKGLGDLFVSHNFNIPTEQVEVVDMMAEKVDHLETENNNQMLYIIELEKALVGMKKNEIVGEMSEDLTAVEADKFKTLVEGFDLDLEDVDGFVTKLDTIRQHHFNKSPAPKTKLIADDVEYSEEQAEKEIKEEAKGKEPNVPDVMRRYMESLKRSPI